MSLKSLFDQQEKTMEMYERMHPVQPGEDRFEKKVLALLVEVGECANEQRSWKYWSNDQDPRTEKLLEEYVDGLHFVLEIGLEHEFDPDGLAIEEIKFSSVTQQFTALMRTDWHIYEEGYGGYYHEGLELYLSLGEMLGFTWEQIEQAYYEKNAVNHLRQEEGY